ncbi:hypothetical protein OC842_005628 [Tilletia horrida]|uniref:Uncharacterized protein n=1 Tax=Tilletia horrida TaxID=155126 RepID=A0AAN6JI99_9BASI|nr:hypothetical protein OC842_005628 [Tilletia horrida]
MAALPASVPALPSIATQSLTQFSDFIEEFVHHRLPTPYIGFVLLYACGHAFFFTLCIPIFAKQIKSGRFWLVRLVTTQRGRVLVPNHLDASATLIGAYTLYDIGFTIKLILCYYQRSSQHNLPALLCMRFMILTTIGWIFLLGFFLVKVPPASFRMSAKVWNIGIFAIPLTIHFGALFLLIKAVKHWNAYWADYNILRPSIDLALTQGLTRPSDGQINLARHMLGVELAGYSRWVFYWSIPYVTWTVLFATAILIVTLSILTTHWDEVRPHHENLPMQTGATRGHSNAMGQDTAKSMTASAGIRKWVRAVPAFVPGIEDDRFQSSHITTESTLESAGTTSFIGDERPSSDFKKRSRSRSSVGTKHNHHKRVTKLVLYGLGLRPLARDAYDDPTGGFSEHRARVGLRSLLRHTALQGGCIFLIAMTQIAAPLIMVAPSFLQPLRTGHVPSWGVEWIRITSALRLVEFYGAGVIGFFLIGSILKRQMEAIELSRARAREGVAGVRTTRHSAEEFQLSAPGPSVSAQWSLHQRTVSRAPALPEHNEEEAAELDMLDMEEDDQIDVEVDQTLDVDDEKNLAPAGADSLGGSFGASTHSLGAATRPASQQPWHEVDVGFPPGLATSSIPAARGGEGGSRTASARGPSRAGSNGSQLLDPLGRPGRANLEDDSVVDDGRSSIPSFPLR